MSKKSFATRQFPHHLNAGYPPAFPIVLTSAFAHSMQEVANPVTGKVEIHEAFVGGIRDDRHNCSRLKADCCTGDGPAARRLREYEPKQI